MPLRYYVRKARYEDPKDLKVFKNFFLKEAERYEGTYYSDHINWLNNKAFPEIEKGINRLAFGAFFSSPNRIPVLLGGIIIKKSDHTEDPRIELKTITVANDTIWRRVMRQGRGQTSESDLMKEIGEEQKNIRLLLLEVVERYANKRAIHKLEVQVPDRNQVLRHVLLKNKFMFIDSQQSRFMRDSIIYSFEKELSLRYCQDPFDFESMVEWMMVRYLGFTQVDLSTNSSPLKWKKKIFELDPITTHALKNAIPGDDKHKISCVCYIFSAELSSTDEEEIATSLEKESFELTYFFSFDDSIFLQNLSNELGIKCYFYRDIRNTLYPQKESDKEIPLPGFPFPKEQIRGLLIVEAGDYSERILEKEAPFNYLIINGIGKFLISDKHPLREDMYVVFYSPHSKVHGVNGEIWGMSKVLDCQKKDFDACLASIKDPKQRNDFIFLEDEFEDRFRGGWRDPTNKTLMFLRLEPVKIFPKPLNIADIASDKILPSIEYDWWNGGLMKMYLDQKTMNSLLKEPRLTREKESNQTQANIIEQKILEKIDAIIKRIEAGETNVDIKNIETDLIRRESIQKFVQRIRIFVQHNRLPIAFAIARSIVEKHNPELLNEVILLENQWNSTQKNLNLSIIDHQEGIKLNSKTIHGFLHLIDEI